jgi:hypothetical protein
MYSGISSNDDDLFAPSKSSSKANNHSEALVDDLENFLKNNSTKEVTSTMFRTRLAHAIYDTSNNFIFGVDAFNRTVYNTLNFLTNNGFAYNLYADVLEESIAKRIVVYDFASTMTDSANKKILAFLSQKTNANLDTFFFNTYVASMLEMLDFSINYNIELYKTLCNHLNRQPIAALIDRDVNAIDPLVMDSSNYIIKSFSSIRKSMGFDL